MAYSLPPPPNSTDLNDISWKRWFFLLNQFAVTLNNISPEALAFAAAHG